MIQPKDYNKKVVVVDDDGCVIRTLKYILKDFDVEYFSDTNLAFDYIIKNFDNIGACFFDLIMPSITGSELATKIRNFNPNKELKIFIFSAASEKALKDASGNRNVNDVISKPLDKKKIKTLLLSENFIEKTNSRLEQMDDQYLKLKKCQASYKVVE